MNTAVYLKNFPTAIDPAEREIVLLFNPRRDSWFDHFLYQDAYVMGLTPTGRATVSLLEMNDPKRRRIRELVAQIDR